MNTTITPPGLEAPLDQAQSKPSPVLVAVKVTVPHALAARLPSSNLIGSSLLTHFLARRIEGQKLQVGECESTGFLNDSWHLFHVAQLTPALECLHTGLDEVHLREYSTILFWHLDGVFAAYGPDNANIGFKFSMAQMDQSTKRIKADHKKVDDIIDKLKKNVALLLAGSVPDDPGEFVEVLFLLSKWCDAKKSPPADPA